MMDAKPQLTTEFRRDQNSLILSYSVVNRARRDIYLLNRLYRMSPAWIMSPDIVYVEFDLKTDTVLLNKRIASIPPDIMVTSPVSPFVTPVRGGETFREHVRIPLPVSEYRQYGRAAPAQQQQTQHMFHGVRFALGYYRRVDGTTEEVRDIHNTPVVFPKTPPGAGVSVELLEGGRVQMEIPGLVQHSPGTGR